MPTMRIRPAILALTLVVLTPSAALADATVFIGRNSGGDDRAVVRGFAVGVSLLVVGFEFEYGNTSENTTELEPSLRTTSGNAFLQTFGLPGFQLYLTTGAGVYRERLGNDQETAFLLNNGGGAKINLAGPLRARVDYRIFNLKGNPRHSTVQRLYAGLNLAF
ncbi:MAG: hypothetical protein EHM55_18600 [Acidobacteria bacterium]|nr:MAG: hypothetical protein EHM55_18600 [Acidobacteriota bacterium]